ncbi:MAG TPA: hypothetical protein VF857_11490, partial [Spirochaetota bacterium]
MLNKAICCLIGAALLFGFSIQSLYAQDKVSYKARITWQGVTGAGGYFVEIRDDAGTVVFQKETRTNEIVPRLPSGEYTLRITVLDQFRKQADSTPWTKIVIRKTATPFFESISPSQFISGVTAKGVIVEGDSFDANIVVSVKHGDIVIPISGFSRLSKEKVSFDLDLEKTPPGEYTLVLENPEGKRLTLDNKIIVVSETPEEKIAREARRGKTYIAVGYQPILVLSPWNGVLKNSYLGGEVYIAQSFCGLP